MEQDSKAINVQFVSSRKKKSHFKEEGIYRDTSICQET